MNGKIIFFSFMLYPVPNLVGSENIVLIHILYPHLIFYSFSAEFWSHCLSSGGTQRRAMSRTPLRKNENIKHHISSSENQIHNLSRACTPAALAQMAW